MREMWAFALAAVAAFSLLNLIPGAVAAVKHPGREPNRVVLVATATDFLSVAAGVATTAGAGALLSGWAAWLVGPFLASIVYVLIQALELTVSERVTERRESR